MGRRFRCLFILMCQMTLAVLLGGCASEEVLHISELQQIVSEDGTVTANVEGCPNAKEIMTGVMAAKVSSHSQGKTVHPGSEVKYAIVFQNKTKSKVTLAVTDEIPETAEYISGGDMIDGRSLAWKVEIPAKSSVSVSYVVKVRDHMSLCDGGYLYSEAKVSDQVLDCHKLYVKRTLNEYDQKKIVMAIKALKNSQFGGTELAKWLYQVAFSQSVTLDGTPAEILTQIYEKGNAISVGSQGEGEEVAEAVVDLFQMVAPRLFGGKAVEEVQETGFLGERSMLPAKEDLIAGDILLVQENVANVDSGKIYVYNGEELFELLEEGIGNASLSKVLNKLILSDRYIVLRPSMVLSSMNYSEPDRELTLTPEQEALIVTAESYLLRGDRIQYDDTTIGEKAYTEYRWQVGLKTPEDYTTSEWGYTNCAAFVHDVYLSALGYDIIWYTTRDLIENDKVFYYQSTGCETEEEKIAVQKQFCESLKPGDIIVMRRGDSGHAMLYIGNGNIIHSTGNSYQPDTATETYEPTIRYMLVSNLFNEQIEKRNIFIEGRELGIVRPLNNWTEGVPDESKNRVELMQGIVAEKSSSHASGVNVNPGEEMTFTFTVYNSNATEVKIVVNDVIPEHTTYVSGAQEIQGDTLSWELVIPAGETGTASYVVKVDEDDRLVDEGFIYSEAGSVGGISVNCPKVYIGNALDTEEKQKLVLAVEECQALDLTGVAFANLVYEKAFHVENILQGESYEELEKGLFLDKGAFYVPKPNGTYTKMLAPTLYGGRTAVFAADSRTRLARKHYLVAGDILFAKNDGKFMFYLYNGEAFLDLEDNGKEIEADVILEKMLACKDYYVILRPSLVM